MPTTIYDSSLLTQRRQAKTIANSFLQRLNTDSSVRNTTSFSSPTGIWSDSILNEVSTGSMAMYRKSDGGAVNISPCCQPQPDYETPGTVSNIFIYLNCLVISWSAPINSGKTGEITYTIAATSSDGGAAQFVSTTNTYYDFENLTPYKNYTFSITATNASGSSASITSYDIYSPPLNMGSFTQSLTIGGTTAWAKANPNSLTPNTFMKQTSTGDKCFGTINKIMAINSRPYTGALFALSDLIGYIAIAPLSSNLNGIGLWKTVDGGLSWNNITEGKIFNTGSPFPNFSYWWNEQEGVVVGDANVQSPLDIYYTSDGGNTWILSSVQPATSRYSVASNNFYSVIGDTIWVLSQDSTGFIWWVQKSINKGKTFTSIKITPPPAILAPLTRISFADQNNGAVISSEDIFYTTNGGTTWTQLLPKPYLTLGSIIDIQCISPSIIFLLCSPVIGGRIQRTLYKVTNLFTGSPIYTPVSNIDRLTSINFNSPLIGYATSNVKDATIKKYIGTTAPTAPIINNSYTGNECIALSILTSDYEFPITKINITPYNSLGVALPIQQFTSIPCNVTGLTNGQTYTFSAQAISESGISDISNVSNAITPISNGVPQPTFIGSVLFSNSNTLPSPIIPRATVYFYKPLNDGGSPITSYLVKILQENGTETNTSVVGSSVANIQLSSTSNIIRAYVLPVNANGQAINYYNAGSVTYSTLRTPTISFNSKTPNSYTINISNIYSSGSQPDIKYNIYTINSNTYEPNISCSPNLNTVVQSTGTSQTIQITNLASGSYTIFATLQTSIVSAGSNILNITIP